MNLQKTKILLTNRAKELTAINTVISLRAEKGYDDPTELAKDQVLGKQVLSEIQFLQQLIKTLS